MARTVVGKNMVAPLLFLNLVMYIIVLGFASWCLNHFINGQSHYPGSCFTFFYLFFFNL
ncbi:hypothetical protein DsansV1_C48g0243711 [Dioscorea sansibarensis]